MVEDGLIIKLTDVSFTYPGSAPVLDQLNLEFYKGQHVGLIGANGSGKTTLFHVIMGLQPVSAGAIEVLGRTVATEKDFIAVRQQIGLLFQDADDQLFSPTVLEDVAFGPLNLGKTKEEAMGIAQETLAYLGLSGFEDRITYKLSGGEKKLVSLATVLAMSPEVVLFDEPTTGLDERTKEKLVEVLSDINLSFMLISHELDFLEKMTDTIYAMEHGKLSADKAVHLHRHVHAHHHGAKPHEH